MTDAQREHPPKGTALTWVAVFSPLSAYSREHYGSSEGSWRAFVKRTTGQPSKWSAGLFSDAEQAASGWAEKRFSTSAAAKRWCEERLAAIEGGDGSNA